jgi:uncharacterized membrane protein (DUF485 family)
MPTPEEQKAQAAKENKKADKVDITQSPIYQKEKGRQDSNNEFKKWKYQNRQANRAARSSRRVVQGSLTVQGAIVGCIVSSVILLAIIVSLGPLVDFFQAWLMNQPGNPYAAPILDLFPWIYIFIFLSWIVSIVVIWRAVTAYNDAGVYD